MSFPGSLGLWKIRSEHNLAQISGASSYAGRRFGRQGLGRRVARTMLDSSLADAPTPRPLAAASTSRHLALTWIDLLTPRLPDHSQL